MDTGVAIALIVAGVVISGIVFFVAGMLYRKKVAEKEIGGAEEEARRILNEAIKSAERRSGKCCWRPRKKSINRVPNTNGK